MKMVEVNHIVKTYLEKTAVNDLSFDVNRGEIFGLIGPNGAGKSSTIRMIMNIIKPDTGYVKILGENLSEQIKNKIGYMPEERGLYKKLTVIDTIIYLASLKGMDKNKAENRANELLARTNMLSHKKKKIEELSKGMGQLIQFIVTIIHNPELIVLDEPFSGLDPANTELIKELISDLRNEGKAVIMSAHKMNEVEELCDRVLMVNNGQSVLYGTLNEIKDKFRNHSIFLNYEGDLKEIPGVIEKKFHKDYVELVLEENMSQQKLLERLVHEGIIINRFEISTPTLNEIFLRIVGEKHE